MAKKKGLIWAIVAVVAVAAIFTGIYLANRPATQEGVKTITFVINGKDASRSVEIHTDREYLGEALTDEKLVEGTESEYGLFVTTVDGYTADDSVQEWWCFSKGGEDLSTGVDTTPIADGDTFKATLKTGW